jgi:hypothetical protein
MLISFKLGQQSIILRIKIPNSGKADNSGVINLNNTTTGLNISTIADCESTAIVYSSLTGNINSITTLGIFSTPESGCCNFRQVDPNNHPGIYEIQLANARYVVSGAKSLLITTLAIPASSAAQSDSLIPLWQDDPYEAKPVNFNLLNIDTSGNVELQPTGLDNIIKDSYTATQAIFLGAAGILGPTLGLPSSPATIKSLDGVNTRAIIAFDSNSNRLSSIIYPP